MKCFSDIHSCSQLESKRPSAFVHIKHLLTYYCSVKSGREIRIKSSQLCGHHVANQRAVVPLPKMVKEKSAGTSLQSAL